MFVGGEEDRASLEVEPGPARGGVTEPAPPVGLPRKPFDPPSLTHVVWTAGASCEAGGWMCKVADPLIAVPGSVAEDEAVFIAICSRGDAPQNEGRRRRRRCWPRTCRRRGLPAMAP